MTVSNHPPLKLLLAKRRSLRAPFSLWCIATALLLLSVAGEDLERFDLVRPAMGTQFCLSINAPPASAQAAAEAAFHHIAELEQICSDYRPDSELTQLNRSTTHIASPHLFAVVKEAQIVAKMTNGAFDITTGHLTQMWRRSKRKKLLPDAAHLSKALALTGWQHVQLTDATREIRMAQPGMQLDLGGIAKGYAADRALQVLKEHGITFAAVAASGDFAIGGPPPGKKGWPIKLRTFEKLEAEDELVELHLSHCGVSTSGDLHQSVEIAGQRYSHIIDAKTGLGLTRRIAATAIAPTASQSDAFATAACVMNTEEALAIADVLGFLKLRIVTLQGDQLVVRENNR